MLIIKTYYYIHQSKRQSDSDDYVWKAQWRHSSPVRPLCLIVRIDAAIISCIAHHCPVQCPGH